MLDHIPFDNGDDLAIVWQYSNDSSKEWWGPHHDFTIYDGGYGES